MTVGGRSQAEHDANVQRLLDVSAKRNVELNESTTISSVSEISVLGYRVGYGTMKPDPERLKPLRELPPPATMKALQLAMSLFAHYGKWIPRLKIFAFQLQNNSAEGVEAN